MIGELHMAGTLEEHYHHPADGAKDICVKCAVIASPDPRSPVGIATPTCTPTIDWTHLPAGTRPTVRAFQTGATRDAETGKFDYEGFLSPIVLRRFAAFMHKHRTQSDGQLRDSDNWQRGMPRDAYMKSGLRHVIEWWLMHRGQAVPPASVRDPQDIEEVLCAVMFNAMGYLYEVLKAKEVAA